MWLRRLAMLLWLLTLFQVCWLCSRPLEVELSLGLQGLQTSPDQVRLEARSPGGEWIQTRGGVISGQLRLQAPGYRPLEVRAQPGHYQLWGDPVRTTAANPAFYLGWVLFALARLRRPVTPSGPRDLGTDWQTVAAYQIVRPLGEGTQAEVFLAEADSGLKVALKLIKEVDEEFQTRFEREAALCARLDHPRIVRTLGWGMHEGRLWMAQSYLPGQTLRNWVNGRGLHASEVRRLLTQICEGLAYAHSLGVFHRDLKPDNILLDSRGQAVIGDFGLARCLDMQTMTRTDVVLGSPAYMSPEQISGQKIAGNSSDLYALGVIGYELLAGRLPFQGDVMQVMMAHLREQPQPLSNWKPDVPPSLEALIMRLLSKEPAKRPKSAAEVITYLQESK